MSVVMLADSIFHLHTLEVLVVPFPDLRDLCSYSYNSLDWRSSSYAGTSCVVPPTNIYFLLLHLVLAEAHNL